MRIFKVISTEYEKDSTKENYNNSVYKYLNSFKKKYVFMYLVIVRKKFIVKMEI